MTQYAAKPGAARVQARSRSLQDRVKHLESRTAGIDSGFPLMILPGVIDSGYTTGDPLVLVNGAATLTGPYQHLASYTPAAGDSVILLPVPALKTYIVAGKLA